VEWLGEVPEHWAIKKLRYVCKIQTGSRDTEEAIEDGEYPFFVRSQTVERINSYSYDCEAVLTAGDGAGVGKVFHYHTGSFDFHQRVYMLNEFNDIHGKLIYHFLKTNFFKVALQGGAKSTVDSLRRPMFTGFPVCIPPIQEQGPLLEFVETEEKRIDKLIATSVQAVSLLQERRSALISAAVTGQIDVRGIAEEVSA
jgi:type I restriction enzyme, S subunit